MDERLPFSKQEFDAIYSKVPRLSVEVLLHNADKGTYLTLRDIEPYKGQWHLPGGTVYFGESLENAVKRVAKRELGINVLSTSFSGYIEYPGHYTKGMGHPLGLVFLVEKYNGAVVVNREASKGQWFKQLPKPTHADQDRFLVEHKFINQ
jgi:8-oxo-dGTP diphosphatase